MAAGTRGAAERGGSLYCLSTVPEMAWPPKPRGRSELQESQQGALVIPVQTSLQAGSCSVHMLRSSTPPQLHLYLRAMPTQGEGRAATRERESLCRDLLILYLAMKRPFGGPVLAPDQLLVTLGLAGRLAFGQHMDGAESCAPQESGVHFIWKLGFCRCE